MTNEDAYNREVCNNISSSPAATQTHQYRWMLC